MLTHMLQAIRRDSRLLFIAIVVVVIAWAVIAYVLLPLSWRHYEHQQGLSGLPMVTRTGDLIPGDPINVGLVGANEDVLCAMNAASWYPADPITLRSSIQIIGSVVLGRPDPDAPVSHLYYLNKREDLAFEKPEGETARRRHHVRFWKVLDRGTEGRAVWLGAVTFDRSVGLSHEDARITHHIAPNIDAERDGLIADLKAAKVVKTIYEVTGIGPTFDGKNGGGDPYYTDGEIKIAVLVQGCDTRSETVAVLANPPMVDLKNKAWAAVDKLLLPGASGEGR